MIYFIRNTRTKNVKVGWSEKPQKRLKALQTSHEDPLELLTAVTAERRAEHRLHHALRAERLHGEWFKSPGLVDQFVMACRGSETFSAACQTLLAFIDWSERDPEGKAEFIRMLERKIAEDRNTAPLGAPPAPTEEEVRRFFAAREESGLLR